MGYKVKETYDGPAGWMIYSEDGEELRFPWELITRGFSISVPPVNEWDSYCEKHSAGWAKGRREEILGRVVEKAHKRYWGKTTATFDDRWIDIQHESRVISWLNKLFGIDN